MKGDTNMSINLHSTVYVEGYCEDCKSETFFWARMIELEMDNYYKCKKCKKGEMHFTKYEIGG
jgi:hypothetical protein